MSPQTFHLLFPVDTKQLNSLGIHSSPPEGSFSRKMFQSPRVEGKVFGSNLLQKFGKKLSESEEQEEVVFESSFHCGESL